MAAKATKKISEKKKIKVAKASPAAKEEKKSPTKAVKPVKIAKANGAVKKASKTASKVDESQVPSPEKQEIISQFAVKSGDTGSPEVQVALLTHRVEKLVGHLKTNPHDNHSRRGLLGIVSKRRRLLNYLEKKDAKRFSDIKVKLGLT